MPPFAAWFLSNTRISRVLFQELLLNSSRFRNKDTARCCSLTIHCQVYSQLSITYMKAFCTRESLVLNSIQETNRQMCSAEHARTRTHKTHSLSRSRTEIFAGFRERRRRSGHVGHSDYHHSGPNATNTKAGHTSTLFIVRTSSALRTTALCTLSMAISKAYFQLARLAAHQ